MELFTEKKECCGCAACVSICPKAAISMIKDETGSYFPKIDEILCINCGA